MSQKVIKQFAPLVKKAVGALINDIISDRLGLAIKNSQEEAHEGEVSEIQSAPEPPKHPEGVVFVSEKCMLVFTPDTL